MAVRIKYQFECPHECGGTCTNGITLDLQADKDPSGLIVIDLGMAASQERFECDTCGCEFYTGDWEDFAQDDGECAYEPPDEDDDTGAGCDPRCCCREDGDHDTCGCHEDVPANAGSTS